MCVCVGGGKPRRCFSPDVETSPTKMDRPPSAVPFEGRKEHRLPWKLIFRKTDGCGEAMDMTGRRSSEWFSDSYHGVWGLRGGGRGEVCYKSRLQELLVLGLNDIYQ